MKSLTFLLLAIFLGEVVSQVYTNSTISVSSYTLSSVTIFSSCHPILTSLTSPPTSSATTSNYTYNTEFTTTKTITQPAFTTISGSSTVNTSTIFVTVNVTTSLSPLTISIVATPSETVGTLTIHETLCSNKPPNATMTVYTGTATPPPGSNRTITPYTWPYATSVDCYISKITGYTHYTTTVGSDTSTITSHPRMPIGTTYSTKTGTYFVRILPAPSVVTITSTLHFPTFSVDQTSSIVITSCAPTITKTLNAKCAPTNLINNDDGQPIDVISDVAFVGIIEDFTSRDPSACCQLCLDNIGCAGMVAGPRGNKCLLSFTPLMDWTWIPNVTCGNAFNYTAALLPIGPDDGFLVQSGCGNVQPAPTTADYTLPTPDLPTRYITASAEGF